MSHYLFCYDSKINSFEITMNVMGLEGFNSIQMESLQKLLKFPTLKSRSSIARVFGLRRGWFLQRCNMSNLAAYENEKSTCNGVIYVLSQEEFDVMTNIYYDMKCLTIARERIQTDLELNSPVKCFIIEKNNINSPEPKFPIYQSVVDATIMGCIDHGGIEFAKEFVSSTSSWNKNWGKKEESYEVVEDILKEILGENLVKKIVSFDFRRIKKGND